MSNSGANLNLGCLRHEDSIESLDLSLVDIALDFIHLFMSKVVIVTDTANSVVWKQV